MKREFTGLEFMLTKRCTHLITGHVRCFTGFLNIHSKIHHVNEKLHQVLLLGIPSLHAKGKEWLPVFQSDRRRQRRSRTFTWFNHIVRTILWQQHETLHALTHPDPGLPRDACRQPATAGRNGNNPTVFVGRLNSGCSSSKITMILIPIGG